ncbi:carbohydrate ABC transporter permease [Halothermothrix orenii]|nr:sugar ABC transporter permease [Halothermothrix orenii]
MIVFLFFIFFPIVDSFRLSFYEWSIISPEKTYLGLQNYNEMFSDWRFWNSLRNTAYYAIGYVPVGVSLSLILALLVNTKIKGRNFFRMTYFLPAIASMSVIAIIWTFLLDPDIGIISYYLKLFGLNTYAWLRSVKWAMPAVILVGIWKNMGFNMVIFLAGLQGISDMYYEAAEIDGANKWQQFIHITLPLLKPTMTFVVIMSVITSFQVFDQVYVMTKGGPLFSTETLVQYIYHLGFENFQMGYAATIAYTLFIIIIIVTIFQLKYFKMDLDN